MPLHYDDDFEEDESEDFGAEDDDSGDTVECPHCGAAIYEQSERCPRCERYISEEEPASRSRHPRWILITALVRLLILLGWILQL